jgi:hypothetical protein
MKLSIPNGRVVAFGMYAVVQALACIEDFNSFDFPLVLCLFHLWFAVCSRGHIARVWRDTFIGCDPEFGVVEFRTASQT